MRIEAPRRRTNSILLTSLVDVMFVLLFFFMLASSYLDWHTLSLNLGGSGTDAQPTGDTWALQVQAGDQYLLNGQPITLADAAAQFSADRKVVLQPGPNVSLQDLVRVLDTLKPTGAAMVLGRAPEVAP